MIIKNITSFEDYNNINNYKYKIINISAQWCKSCNEMKEELENFIINKNDNNYIYIKIDYEIYEQCNEFLNYFKFKKIPYFAFMENNKVIEYFESGNINNVINKINGFIDDNSINNLNFNEMF